MFAVVVLEFTTVICLALRVVLAPGTATTSVSAVVVIWPWLLPVVNAGTVVLSTINRNPKSYLFAIVGAEYVLSLLPRGTHDWSKFVKPSEMATYARRAGLTQRALIGMTYNPFTQAFRLEPDTSVNYLTAFRRTADA